MPLLARSVNAPLAVEVGHGALRRLPDVLSDSRISTHGTVAVVVGPGVGERAAALATDVLPTAVVHTVEGATLEEARRLESILRSQSLDAVVAVGGGSTVDVAKWAASMLGLPLLAAATNLAHDGIASPVAVLEADGYKRSFGVHIPLAVVVDLDFVVEAPAPQILSGVGDVVSNLSAVEDWLLARDAVGEQVDGLAVALARPAAEAVLRHGGDLRSSDFLHTLAHALVLSGMAMSVAGSSRPCSGACHEVSHAIDALFPGTASHGEQVAVGCLFAMHLRDSEVFADTLACFRRHGLPTAPADLGLDTDQFAKAVVAAPGTRPDRYTILEHRNLGEADARQAVAAFVDAVTA